MQKKTVFPCYLQFLSPQIVKTANTKPANSVGRLYLEMINKLHYLD